MGQPSANYSICLHLSLTFYDMEIIPLRGRVRMYNIKYVSCESLPFSFLSIPSPGESLLHTSIPTSNTGCKTAPSSIIWGFQFLKSWQRGTSECSTVYTGKGRIGGDANLSPQKWLKIKLRTPLDQKRNGEGGWGWGRKNWTNDRKNRDSPQCQPNAVRTLALHSLSPFFCICNQQLSIHISFLCLMETLATRSFQTSQLGAFFPTTRDRLNQSLSLSLSLVSRIKIGDSAWVICSPLVQSTVTWKGVWNNMK